MYSWPYKLSGYKSIYFFKMKYNLALIFLLTTLLALGMALPQTNCSGNCPSGTCYFCICGEEPDMISVDDYCNSYDGWDKDCCECIIDHISKGNAHYMGMHNVGHIRP